MLYCEQFFTRQRPMQYDLIIVGGGPAGMMAGHLFARAGVSVIVLEKHGDFLRDFRGDTVHPSTMEILDQLGMLERFLARPHDRIEQARVRVAGRFLTIGDLRFLPTPAPFIAMMPQWDFLDFLREESQRLARFTLRMNAEVTELVETDGRISGVRLADDTTLRARRLVLCADGRSSLARRILPLRNLGAPMDVFWFRVPRKAGDQEGLRGIFDPGRILVMIGRQDYWQCAYLFPKGGADAVRSRGLAALRHDLEEAAPDLAPLDAALTDWAQLHLLTVALDRLANWHRPGVLAIGDAAHAMSPIGGIGINLAIQDAVAAANILAQPLAEDRGVDDLLAAVQRRRQWPTRLIQAGQKFAQDNVIGVLLARRQPVQQPPLALRMLDRFPRLRRIPGRIIGLGVRRERVASPIHGAG
jgi:2-polyprenyl-6-methoxyphenol hydroxylase-like FAD-dependent oxidoreductase